MMTIGLQASAQQPTRVSAWAGDDILPTALSWNPMQPIGVAGTMSDQLAESTGAAPFLVKQAIRGPDCRKNAAFIQLRKSF